MRLIVERFWLALLLWLDCRRAPAADRDELFYD